MAKVIILLELQRKGNANSPQIIPQNIQNFSIKYLQTESNKTSKNIIYHDQLTRSTEIQG